MCCSVRARQPSIAALNVASRRVARNDEAAAERSYRSGSGPAPGRRARAPRATPWNSSSVMRRRHRVVQRLRLLVERQLRGRRASPAARAAPRAAAQSTVPQPRQLVVADARRRERRRERAASRRPPRRSRRAAPSASPPRSATRAGRSTHRRSPDRAGPARAPAGRTAPRVRSFAAASVAARIEPPWTRHDSRRRATIDQRDDHARRVSISLPDRRNQILVERACEIVRRREAPVAPRGAVVDVRRPRIDDRLPLGVDPPADRRSRKRRGDDIVDLLRRRAERASGCRRCASARSRGAVARRSSASIASGIAMNGMRVSGRTKQS